MTKKALTKQVDKPFMSDKVPSLNLNQIKNDLQDSNQLIRLNSDEEELFEMEPNNDFSEADFLPNEKVMVGQHLPLFDVDFFEVSLPDKGILYVLGTTNSDAIELLFEAFEKDFGDNGYLEYLGNNYENGIEIQAYQVHKAGTYYIGAIDSDNEDYDDNSEEDSYAIMTSFVGSTPSVNEVTEHSTSVTGTAEAGSTITVKAGSTVIGEGITTIEGNYSVSIPKQRVDTVLAVYATDSNGNVSEARQVTVKVLKMVDRIAGADRIKTAIAISKKGWVSAQTVILAQGYNFPDALAASPLATKLNAPILLTNQKAMTAETIAELKRLNTKKVIIVGGEVAISKAVKDKLEALGIGVERLSGSNRFATAVKIAERLGGYPQKAIVTDGYNFPDALAISSYAAQNGFPILLTQSNQLPIESKAFLKTIPETIVMGGDKAVSSTVFNQLNQPLRISGENRYETAAAVIEKLKLPTDKVYVATGQSFADALTGSVLAAKNKAPIILVEKNMIPESTAQLITKYDIRNFTLLGGEMVISRNLFE